MRASHLVLLREGLAREGCHRGPLGVGVSQQQDSQAGAGAQQAGGREGGLEGGEETHLGGRVGESLRLRGEFGAERLNGAG